MLQLLPDAVDLTEYLPASQATQSSQVLFESVLGLLNPALQEQFIFMVDPAAESAWTPQGRQLSTPLLPIVVEYLPAPQTVHTVAVERENLPAAHSTHDAEPGRSLNVPAAHAKQGPPLGPVNPALQLQLLSEKLPAEDEEFGAHTLHTLEPAMGANLPTMHAMHTPCPNPSLNFPAAHASHAPPSGPVKPAMHLHSVTLALPSPETEFDGHAAHALPSSIEYVLTEQCTHTLDELAPTTDENLPPAHCTQGSDPLFVLNVPALQALHFPQPFFLV